MTMMMTMIAAAPSSLVAAEPVVVPVEPWS
jgi:hypothetical protein